MNHSVRRMFVVEGLHLLTGGLRTPSHCPQLLLCALEPSLPPLVRYPLPTPPAEQTTLDFICGMLGILTEDLLCMQEVVLSQMSVFGDCPLGN